VILEATMRIPNTVIKLPICFRCCDLIFGTNKAEGADHNDQEFDSFNIAMEEYDDWKLVEETVSFDSDRLGCSCCLGPAPEYVTASATFNPNWESY
tara:strand:- start:2657 stop:2944 length:288 start_codon:yes stop_codon:yes gene_type:complete